MAKVYFADLPSVLCKIFGVYKVGSHNKETDKRISENVVVMENIFYQVMIYMFHVIKPSPSDEFPLFQSNEFA